MFIITIAYYYWY